MSTAEPQLLTPSRIASLLEQHGITPSRALGQNFLADPNTARRIVRLAGVEPGDRVVEIGPGIGSLTLALVAAGAWVLALELDRHVIRVLADVCAGTGVRIEQGDALDADWPALLGGGAGAPGARGWKVVSNLPYNVATPVVVGVLERAPMVGELFVMVQREVGERLAATPGTKSWGAVSAKVAYFARAEVVGTVPPTVFIPRPKVESALVRLVRHDAPPVHPVSVGLMFRLIRAGFGTRRKTLRNALLDALGPGVAELLQRAGIDPGARAETLELPQWARLADVVHATAPGVTADAETEGS